MPKTPFATYRLQLRPGFGLDDAAAIARYLAELGISHLYSSPYLQAARGSTHGYDVIDPSRINDELGGEDAHARFCRALDDHGLGQVLDIVPNHMAVTERRNVWWWDVLENGPSSRYASYFDVDWDPPQARLRNTVLLPILGDHYGRVLEAGELQLVRRGGRLEIHYHEHRMPVAPPSLDALMAGAARRCPSPELAFIADALGRLPLATATDRESVARRHRDKEVLAALLARLCDERPEIAAAVDAVVAEVNADADRLDELLSRQNYRPAFWRTAGQELDYRRFFDVHRAGQGPAARPFLGAARFLSRPAPAQNPRRGGERAGDALPAAHRAGDGERGGGHRLLQLPSPGVAQRGGRQPRRLRDLGGGVPPLLRGDPAAVAADHARHFDARHQAQRGRAGADQPALGDPRALGRGGWADRNAEYLLYQTLVGAWPISAERVTAYMLKAAREAKARTAWTRIDAEYEEALGELVKGVLEDAELVADLEAFVAPLVTPGRLNSLAQTLLKLTAPGVPDFYQGTELWDLSLVDPDNRRPVDYELRRRLLGELATMGPTEILARMEEGLPKLWLIRQGLHLRRRRPTAFSAEAAYEPLPIRGPRADHAIAFLRGGEVAVVVPRLVIRLGGDWGETFVELPPGRWSDELSGAEITGGPCRVADLLAGFPVALLRRALPKSDLPRSAIPEL